MKKIYTVSWKWEAEWEVVAESEKGARVAANAYDIRHEVMENFSLSDCEISVFGERDLSERCPVEAVARDGYLHHPCDIGFDMALEIARQERERHEQEMLAKNYNLFEEEGEK